MKLLTKVDRYQRSHAWMGFPLGVLKKFGEDKAGQLAALVAYYGFFSLFPLLLVLVTVLGFVLGDNPELQGQILDSALKQFPIIGDQIKDNIHALSGSGVTLAIGIGGALWAGLAGVKAAQNGMDAIWDVPVKGRPKALLAILRALAMLATLGVFVLVAGFLGGVAAGTETAPLWLQAVAVAGTLVLNFLVFLIGFRVLTVAKVSFRDVLPGAAIAALLWSILQTLGGYIIGHRLESASQVYGFFAVVIGLLSWLYLGAQVTLLCAELNVVRVKRLWPRALDPDDLTDADRRAFKSLAEAEERSEEQDVRVEFDASKEGKPSEESIERAREEASRPPDEPEVRGDEERSIRDAEEDSAPADRSQVVAREGDRSASGAKKTAAVGAAAGAAGLGWWLRRRGKRGEAPTARVVIKPRRR